MMSGLALRRSTRLLSVSCTASTSNSRHSAALSYIHEEELTEQEDSPSTPVSPRPSKRARKEKIARPNGIPVASDAAPYEEVSTNSPANKTARLRKAQPVQLLPGDFAPRALNAWKVGPHVSAAGGVENAIINAARAGANAFALFLKSQRKWTSSPLTKDSVLLFKSRMKAYGYSPEHILPHGSYLVNLGNPDEEKREKSYQCFLDDIKRCQELGLHLYNFHPGSTIGQVTAEECFVLIAECINRAHNETENVVIVLENMAGSGNVIGSRFSELGGIIKHVKNKSRVGVCLDTCHMFAAGYDIRTRDGWNATMTEFEQEVGLKYLRGMHLNDSKVPLGSKKDRHENIGLGQLGLVTFSHVLSDPRTRDLPLILETPAFDTPGSGGGLGATGGMDVWRKEVEVLNQLATCQDEVKDERFEKWEKEIEAIVKKASSARDARGKKKVEGDIVSKKRKRNTKKESKKYLEEDADGREEDAEHAEVEAEQCDSCAESDSKS